MLPNVLKLEICRYATGGLSQALALKWYRPELSGYLAWIKIKTLKYAPEYFKYCYDLDTYENRQLQLLNKCKSFPDKRFMKLMRLNSEHYNDYTRRNLLLVHSFYGGQFLKSVCMIVRCKDIEFARWWLVKFNVPLKYAAQVFRQLLWGYDPENFIYQMVLMLDELYGIDDEFIKEVNINTPGDPYNITSIYFSRNEPLMKFIFDRIEKHLRITKYIITNTQSFGQFMLLYRVHMHDDILKIKRHLLREIMMMRLEERPKFINWIYINFNRDEISLDELANSIMDLSVRNYYRIKKELPKEIIKYMEKLMVDNLG